MLRKIITIDEDKCNGCGKCAKACHEGAIEMINGKAVLTREDYCDGLGDCLPACPTGAISFEEREAPAYNEAAVSAAKQKKASVCSCPSAVSRSLPAADCSSGFVPPALQSRLMQWPCQIKLVPVNAPYFDNANLLIAADCSAFSFGNFHNEFMKNHITLIGCPKLDGVDYTEKLAQIFAYNNIKSVHVVRMEVPCCSGLYNSVQNAILKSGKSVPLQTTILSTDGKILRKL